MHWNPIYHSTRLIDIFYKDFRLRDLRLLLDEWLAATFTSTSLHSADILFAQHANPSIGIVLYSTPLCSIQRNSFTFAIVTFSVLPCMGVNGIYGKSAISIINYLWRNKWVIEQFGNTWKRISIYSIEFHCQHHIRAGSLSLFILLASCQPNVLTTQLDIICFRFWQWYRNNAPHIEMIIGR